MSSSIFRVSSCLALAFTLGTPSFSLAQPSFSGSEDVAFKAFAQTLELLRRGHVDPLPPDEFYKLVTDGIVSRFDSHTAYMDSEEYSKFKEDMNGRYAGIGVIASRPPKPEPSGILIGEVHPEGPAFKAGILEGDLIVAANGQKLGQDLEENIKLVKGPAGTSVKLDLLREGKVLRLNVSRDFVTNRSVDAALRDIGNGNRALFVRIRTFNAQSPQQLAKALRNNLPSGPSAIVFDLRDNSGGSLDACIAMTSLFVEPGRMIAFSKGREGKKEEYLSRDFAMPSETEEPGDALLFGGLMQRHAELFSFDKLPIYILTNSSTASASEIFAAALREHGRAVLVGERTFGKGSVQTLVPLADGGALKITISRYYTPSGKSLQAIGVSPDLAVEDNRAWREVSLRKARGEHMRKIPDALPREENLPRHLGNEPNSFKEIRKAAASSQPIYGTDRQTDDDLPETGKKDEPFEKAFSYEPFIDASKADPITATAIREIGSRTFRPTRQSLRTEKRRQNTKNSEA